jgi:YVTN family beta-propeller protein
MIFEKGDFIQNKYQVDKILYSDNEGVIYSCKYRNGYKIVKQIFSAESNRSEDLDKLFSGRCSELKKLNHRNLVQIDDFFIEEGSYFAVMEQIKGKNLEELYRHDYKGRVFPSDVLMQYMLKVCDGLKYMHGQKPPVLHGAIAPTTILTGGGGLVKLINYGLAPVVRHGFNKGFDGFAAPEQVDGKKEDIASDIYGIASLMYYLLSGKKYEAGIKKIETLMSSNPQVSKNLAELIAKCLSKKISNRPDTGDFSRQLSKLYLSETVLKATREFSMSEPEEEEDDLEEVSPSEQEESSVKEEKSKEETVKPSVKEEKSKEETVKPSVEEEEKSKEETVKPSVKEEKSKEKTVKPSVQEKDIEVNSPVRLEEEDIEKKKKKKKKKKKLLTGELKEDLIEEISQKENEIIAEEKEDIEGKIEDRADETEEPETYINTEYPESEPVSDNPEVDSKEKKKKKKKKKKKEVLSVESGEIKEDFDEITEDYEEQDESSEEDTINEAVEKIEEKSEKSEKKQSKPSLRTRALSMQLLSAIKHKEEEDIEEVREEPDKEIKEEIKEDNKEEIKKDDGVTQEKAGKDGKKLTRKSSIADFLRSKTGLKEEEYEVNKDLVSKGRRKSGLSEEFLASLKATSGSSSIRASGDAIKEVSFPLYNKPSIDPPYGIYEEVDMLKNNRYEVRELLHKDCYGGIYIVQDYDEHDDEKSTKILKDIQYKGTNGDTVKILIERFQKLYEKLTKLSHAGLVKIEDYFYTVVDNGNGVRFSLIMEYIEGMSFNEVARTYYSEDEKSQMPAKTVFGVISKVYSVLEYLHNNGIVCGDIRPSNLILTSDGNIKFLNYGLSCIFYGISDEVYPCKGVYGYVAPELKCLPDADLKSDIFSLGAVMYFMLTGSNPEEISYKFQPIRKLNPFLSLQVERFIQSLLSYTPENRPEIGQIIRVMDSLSFFEVTKEKQSKSDIGPLKNPGKDSKEKEILVPGNFDHIKENLSSFSLILKKVPPQLTLIIIGICAAIVFLVLWITSYVRETVIPKDMAYIIMSGGGGINAVNIDNKKVFTNLSIPDCKSKIAFSESRKELYVIGSITKILIVDILKCTVKNAISVDNNPYDIAISKDEKILYMTIPSSSELQIFSLEEKKKISGFSVGKTPADLLLIEEKNLLLILDYSENNVYGFNIKTNKIDFQIKTGQSPISMCYIPKLDLIYVSNWISNNVSIINLTVNKLGYTIPVGSHPCEMALSLDQSKLYLANQGAYTISVIDVSSHKVEKDIKLDGQPVNVILSEDGSRLFACLKNEMKGNGKIVIYKTSNLNIEKEINSDEINSNYSNIYPLNIFLNK